MKRITLKKSIVKITTLLIILLSVVSIKETKAQGPNAPEASNFEPVSATDMVNLSSGDMAYVLPLFEIDGFPVTLSYHAGIPMDMEASWVGLGWNINTGAITRGVVATPDDWNNGKSLKFTYYSYNTRTYTVNVGVGFGKAAEVGVGLSWGSNKSLSGSVSASVGPISATMDSNGNYIVGLSASVASKFGFKNVFDKVSSKGNGESSPFGGGLSISGNVNRGGFSVNAGVGGSIKGLNYGLGTSITGNGIGGGSFSIGGGSNNEEKTNSSAGGGGSIGAFSAGDISVKSSGFYVPINIGIFNFGFGFQKSTIRYHKGLNRYGFGSFYMNQLDLYEFSPYENLENPDGIFLDYQRRNYYGDLYDQTLPESEEVFVSNYKIPMDKVNFTFIGYDSYNVNASGISGRLKPLIGENIALIGEGFEGQDPESSASNKRIKIFYHNSLDWSSPSTPVLSPLKGIDNNLGSMEETIFFSFDGQIVEDVNISATSKDNTSSLGNIDMGYFVNWTYYI